MRIAALFCVVALASCTPPGTGPHSEFQWTTCQAGVFGTARVDACSAVANDTGAEPERRAQALVQRGMLRAETGQYGRAVADFGRALRIVPGYVNAYIERGFLHHQRGAFEIAVRDFDEALRLDPTNTLAEERRAAALVGRVDRYRARLDQINELIEREPRSAELLNERCWLRATNNDNLDLALADCTASLAINSRYGAALDSRGFVHLKRGDFAAALNDYEAALAVEANRPHYLYGRGVARRGLGQIAEGDADIAAALRLDPDIAEAYRGYGLTL